MARIGRPTLTDEELGELLGSLIPFPKGSSDFRQKRREMAIRFRRTERAIDDLFNKALARFRMAEDSARSALASDTGSGPRAQSGDPKATGARPDSTERGAA